MVNRMIETYFIEYKNTEIEINTRTEDIRLMIGSKQTLLTPPEAETIGQMLIDASMGKGYDDDEILNDAWEMYEHEEDLGERNY